MGDHGALGQDVRYKRPSVLTRQWPAHPRCAAWRNGQTGPLPGGCTKSWSINSSPARWTNSSMQPKAGRRRHAQHAAHSPVSGVRMAQCRCLCARHESIALTLNGIECLARALTPKRPATHVGGGTDSCAQPAPIAAQSPVCIFESDASSNRRTEFDPHWGIQWWSVKYAG